VIGTSRPKYGRQRRNRRQRRKKLHVERLQKNVNVPSKILHVKVDVNVKYNFVNTHITSHFIAQDKLKTSEIDDKNCTDRLIF